MADEDKVADAMIASIPMADRPKECVTTEAYLRWLLAEAYWRLSKLDL